MADAAAGDTSSTPTTVAPAPVTPAATAEPSQPAPAIQAAPSTTPDTAQPAPAKTDSTPATTATTADTAPKTDATQAAAPEPAAFKLPEDLKLAPDAVTKFTDFVKGKSGADGKVTLSPQEIVDLYADQARTAAARWQAQLAEQDKTWAAESKARFSAPQLAAAETGVGFLTSFDPAFRELAQGFRNHPVFVNVMRVIGERLSEDTFEIGGAPPTPPKRAAKDVLYPKRTN